MAIINDIFLALTIKSNITINQVIFPAKIQTAQAKIQQILVIFSTQS